MENKFILGTSGPDLLAVDQHALHERVNLEHLERLLLAELTGHPLQTFPGPNPNKFKRMVLEQSGGASQAKERNRVG